MMMERAALRVRQGPLILLASAALAWAVIAVTLAALAPPSYVPHIFHSYHVEHLAAFYILALISAAAFPRRSLLTLAAIIIGFAILLALVRAFQPAHRLSGAEDLLCDIAGVWTAMAPVVVGRFRAGALEPVDESAEAKPASPWRRP